MERGAAGRPSYLCAVRLLLAALALSLGIACSPHPGHLSEPPLARVVAAGSSQLTMEVQELI